MMNHRKAFNLAGMVMIATGDTRHSSRERDLSADPQFYGFHKHAALVFMLHQFARIDGREVHVTTVGIEKVHFNLVFQSWDKTLIKKKVPYMY